MSIPVSINDRLEAAALKAEGASEIMRLFANGPAGDNVATESGSLPTIAEWLDQQAAAIGNLPARMDQAEIDIDTIEAYNLARQYYRTIEEFGSVATPAATTVTMQAAIDYCAANKVLLRGKAAEYTIDVSAVSITIPDNFRCDLGNAWIKRATGNATPHDMWINADTVNGNTGLDIRNVRFDGQRVADSLTNATVAHRFAGLRLIKCSGYVENVRADWTCNGEQQAEGNRGAIVFELSTNIRARFLFADNNLGVGVAAFSGKHCIWGVWTVDNSGSGFGSQGIDDNELFEIHSDGSGNSGVSINGKRVKAAYLSGTRAAVGKAGVNIGHTTETSKADDSQIDHVFANDNFGWGIVCTSSTNIRGIGWEAKNNVTRNIQISDCPGMRVQYKGRASQAGEMLIKGTTAPGDYWLTIDASGSVSSGVTLQDAGNRLFLSAESKISGSGTSGTVGAILAEVGATIVCRGQLTGNNRYGAIASGAGAKVILPGARVTGNAAGNVLASGGGVIEYEATRLSETDAMSGTFTITSGTASVVVNNGNVIDANRIAIFPADAAARTAGDPIVTISAGVSFTATIAANAAANATYRYIIL